MKTTTLESAKKRIKKAQESYCFMCQQLSDPPKTDIVGNALRRVKVQLSLVEADELQRWFDKLYINTFK